MMTLSIFSRTSAVVSPSVIQQCGSFPWDSESDLYKICEQNGIAPTLTDKKECIFEGDWNAMITVFNQIAKYLNEKYNIESGLLIHQDFREKNNHPQANNGINSINRLKTEVPDPLALPVNESTSTDTITDSIVDQVAEYIKTHTTPKTQPQNHEETNCLLYRKETDIKEEDKTLSTKISRKQKNTVAPTKTKYAIVTRNQKLLETNISAFQENQVGQKNIKDKFDCRDENIDVSLHNTPQKSPLKIHNLEPEPMKHITHLNEDTSSAKLTFNRTVKTKKKQYSCDRCPYLTTKKADLNKHEKDIHDIKTWSCSKCGKICNSKKYLQQHEKSHLEGLCYCEICGKFYKAKRTLEQHLKSHEKSYIKPEFECKTCKRSFSTKYVLNYHIKSQHLGMKKQFLCSTCGKSFTQKNSYLQHANVHNGLKPFQCEHCGKSFAYEKSLKEHRFMHDDVLHFKCEVCGKLFRQSSALQIHQKIHKDVKDFLCGTCGKGFTQKQALIRHERIHNGTKPFSCGLCSRTFNDASIIRRHMILVHKKDSKEWREDVICDLQGSKEYWIDGKKPERVKMLPKNRMKDLGQISEKVDHNKPKLTIESKDSNLASRPPLNGKNKFNERLENGSSNVQEISTLEETGEKIIPSSLYLPDNIAEGSDILLHSPSISQYIQSTTDTTIPVSLDQTFDNFTNLQDRKSDVVPLTFQTSLPGRSENQWTAEPLQYSANVHYLPHHHFTNYQNQ